jgi:serine/threonine protein kinase
MTEEDLFEAVSNTPTRDRTKLLDRECAGEPELRARIESRLAVPELPEVRSQDEPDRAPTPDPCAASTATTDQDSTEICQPDEAAAPRHGRSGEGVGSLLAGKYKLLQELGAGGMGVVFMAQQLTPVRRTVAVKVIKTGMDTGAVLARFEAERQALALMDHPNIAKVLDAGATDSGRPYFVMELVKGTPITIYCDLHRLTIRERLELFLPVCQAIQHAHQKGIIHRDIKPTNVLVGLGDDRPVPKVIDFGLAKATGTPLTERTLLTGLGTVVGTPQYMSPEQATPNNCDIDTRSDVYALGVLLYELLTGTTPVDHQGMGQAAMLAILRVVCEVEPPTPSSRLSTLEALPSVAASRGTAPARLPKLLRGELDWIAMKALEKDRSRRYETANALARDVQHYLAHEVVEARPPSALYRLRKFARRHMGRVVAASLVLLALVAGTIGTTWGYLRAERARQAEAERAEGEHRAKQEAQEERDNAMRAERAALEYEQQRRKYAEAIADFVREDFLAPTGVEGQPRSDGGPEDVGPNQGTSLRQLLDRAAERLSRRRDLEPRTEAELNWIVGVNYRAMGETRLALPYLERCLSLRQKVLGREDPSTLNAQNSLARAYLAAGEPDLALPLYEEAWRLKKAKLGLDDPDTLKALDNLAVGCSSANRLDRSALLFEEALKLREKKLGRDHPDTLQTVANLGVNYKDAGRLSDALRLLGEAYRASGTIPALRWVGVQLLDCYAKANQPAEAAALLQRLLADAHRSLPKDGPQLAEILAKYGSILLRAKAFGEAEPLLRECLAIREAAEPDAWTTFYTRSLLGRALLGQQRHTEAEPLLRQGYEGMKAREKAIPPRGATRVPEALDRLIELYATTNRPNEVSKWQAVRAKYPRDATPQVVGSQAEER